MYQSIFKCKIISPLFMNGADNSKFAVPELRAPGIKGMLRFWWRALNGHHDLATLKKYEGEIFGDNEKRSKLIINIKSTQFIISDEKPVPHKDYMSKAIAIGSTFDIELTLLKNVVLNGRTIFTGETLKALFLLATLLGGFGKRIRRGMGCVSVKSVGNMNYSLSFGDVIDLIHLITPHYSLQQDKIVFTYNGRLNYYPWLRTIEIGDMFGTGPEEVKHKLLHISNTTHHLKQKNRMAYEPSLGHAFKGRFASPVFVSLCELQNKLYPIFSTLNTVPDKNKGTISLLLQDEFKNTINIK